MTDKEKIAIERIKLASQISLHQYGEPLICAYSGGKDSDVMLSLFQRADIPFEVQNSHTTVDAPPTVYHIRKVFKELEGKGIKATINMPKLNGKPITMWTLIPYKRMPPTRIARYCCDVLKEQAGGGRMVATGVRWAESTKRKSRNPYEIVSKKENRISIGDEVMLNNDNDERRRFFERCELKAKSVVNPIIDWTDAEIWDYYNTECPHKNPMYDMGYYRVGCVGCPMASSGRWKEFADFPTYERAYKRAFKEMLDILGAKNTRWKDEEDVFRWWMEDKNIEGQLSLQL